MLEIQNQSVIQEIKQILTEARDKVARTVNNELLLAVERTDQGAWQRIFSFKPAIYEKILS